MVYSKTLKIENLIDELPDASGYLIAYSGGADSTALLHLFKDIPNIRAIHINHGLQTSALDWQNHCQRFCDQHNIQLIIEKAQLTDDSENSCRQARYDFFAKHLRKDELLVTAHHADDQAETVLMKLLRGTGIKGLSGIEKIRPFAEGQIVRPLLNYRAQQLKNHLLVHQLAWIEDPSNQQTRYRRNFIRQDILPLLEQQFPQATNNITRSAESCRNTQELLQHQCQFNDNALDIVHCQQLPTHLQASLLYQWLSTKNLPIPYKKTLKQITHDFLNAKKHKRPSYINRYYQLIRWQGAIHCIKNLTHIDSSEVYPWHTNQDFVLPNGCGTLCYTGTVKKTLQITFAQKGLSLQTHQHQFSKKVKQLFQEQKIPPWQKANTPYIFENHQLVSLGYDWSHNRAFKGLIQLSFEDWHL